jgi:glucose-6-phosphate 1-dehydrogenase
MLPEVFKIVGISRQDTSSLDIVENTRASIEARGEVCDQDILDQLAQNISIFKMSITEPDRYLDLKKYLDDLEAQLHETHKSVQKIKLKKLFYMAVPSTILSPIIDNLGSSGLNKGSRLMIEKPFGYDLISAQELVSELGKYFEEDQIYRIDHYLAKETAQNIMTFRFENPLFNTSWDNKHIKMIMITASESIGIEGRSNFYEQTGALRDLIQGHLLQILSIVMMDKPDDMTAESVHFAKEALLKNIENIYEDQITLNTVRGQYDTYRSEVNNPDSTTETYAAIRLNVRGDRWQGVPVFIRAGKALKDKVTEVAVIFGDSDEVETPRRGSSINFANVLTIRIQPNEGIGLDLRIKKPGFENEIKHVQMDFCYHELRDLAHPDAYERVLVDSLRGDRTLFATSQEVLESWRILDPILNAWQNRRGELEIYETGSWGPKSADHLVARDSGEWTTDLAHICQI